MIGFGMAIQLHVTGPELPVRFSDEKAPSMICRVCDTPSTMAREYADAGGRPVCGVCADVIANIYNYQHGGQYLTWPNEESPRRAGYRKKEIPDTLRWQVFERDDFRCRECGARQRLRADHIVAESRGGEASLANLQTLCHRCNSRKGTGPA